VIDGVNSRPFSAVTLPTPHEKSYIKEPILNQPQEFYGKSI
jgi:hypothetical protein